MSEWKLLYLNFIAARSVSTLYAPHTFVCASASEA